MKPVSYIPCTVAVVLHFLLSSCTVFTANEYQPAGLFLTWQDDPTTTMTIDWHTTPAEDYGIPPSVLYFRETDSDTWEEVEGSVGTYPYSDRTLHRVELTGLEPDTYYSFRMSGFDREFRFRTMPEEVGVNRPLRFVNGGDTFPTVKHDLPRDTHGLGKGGFRRMNDVVMNYDLDFIVWGGDIVYDDGLPQNVDLWYAFFEGIMETLIDEDGRVIPIVVAIGNHETFQDRHLLRYLDREQRHYDLDEFSMTEEEIEAYMEEHDLNPDDVEYFYDLFAFPGNPAHNVLDFGNYLSLFILDSGHGTPILGSQVDWLEQALRERQDQIHLIPVYHAGAYPSVRNYRSGAATSIRENWVPLFEEYGVRAALEHHDHAYKRTHPILNEEINPDGIVFLGDGQWGVGSRVPNSPEDVWFLEKSASTSNAIIITLYHNDQHFLMVNEHGEVIDEYYQRIVDEPDPL